MDNRFRLDPNGALDVAGPTEGSWGRTDAMIDPIIHASITDHDPSLYANGELGTDVIKDSLAKRGIFLATDELGTVLASMRAINLTEYGSSGLGWQIDYNEGGNDE